MKPIDVGLGHRFTCAAVLLMTLGHTTSHSHADDFLSEQPLAILEKDAIDESSGLAVGRRANDVFWTHNDSNGKPRLFAFDRTGKHLGTSRIQGAEAIDWEDMGSFAVNRHPYLFVADVGDNAKAREHYTIYVVKEPFHPSRMWSAFQFTSNMLTARVTAKRLPTIRSIGAFCWSSKNFDCLRPYTG